MSRYLAIGDPHGAYKSLIQALERANYDPTNDTLIFLGDVEDGWPETKQCLDFVVEQPNVIFLRGNHTEWFRDWIFGIGDYKYSGNMMAVPEWWSQGGKATLQSYYPDLVMNYETAHLDKNVIPESHKKLLHDSLLYYVLNIDDEEILFVHGGCDPNRPLKSHHPEEFLWDRNLWQEAVLRNFEVYAGTPRRKEGNIEPLTGPYKEIFLGHTTTTRISDIPITLCGITNLDQGSGWEGKLSVMNVETHEFWQSDMSKSHYPDHIGRR